MSEWFSWNELLDQGIKDFELLKYLKEGLQPYSRPDKPIYCPYKYHLYTYLYKKHTGLNNLIQELERFDPPEKISSEGIELKFWMEDYPRKSIEKYNRDVTAKDHIQIHDEFIDLEGQFGKLSKFKQCLEKKQKETLKKIEDIIDDDPDLNEGQKKLSWKYFSIPDSEEEYNNIVLKLENAFFKKEDVKTIQNKKITMQDKTKVFPCNPGTKWDQIEMSLLPNEEKFMVKTPIGQEYYDHIELGLFDRRKKSGAPTKLWGLLKQLAKREGFFPLAGVQNFDRLSSAAKRLDAHLKKLFGINHSIYKDRCDRIGGYRTKFKIVHIPDNKAMVGRTSLIEDELEDPKYSNIKESSYFPEHSTFKNE